MYKLNNKIISAFIISALASISLFASAPNNQPDTPPEVNSLRTPLTIQPFSATQVQRGYPLSQQASPVTLAPNAGRVYNKLINSFSTGQSDVDPLNKHFNFQSFKASHTLLNPHNTPWSFSANIHGGKEMRIYFVDTQSKIRSSLGVIDRSQYPTSSADNPLRNLANKPGLIFPYAKDAVKFLPRTGGLNPGIDPNNPYEVANAGKGQYANGPKDGLYYSNYNADINKGSFGHPFYYNSGISTEHPLLFTDMVSYTIPTGKTIDFFLIPNIDPKSLANQASTSFPFTTSAQTIDTTLPQNYKPFLSPSFSGIWTSDVVHNFGGTNKNFQHFQFYDLPEMGPGWYLAAVEAGMNGCDSCCCPRGCEGFCQHGETHDFDDLFFVVNCPVPEPETYLLIGSLLMAAFVLSRKRECQVNI